MNVTLVMSSFPPAIVSPTMRIAEKLIGAAVDARVRVAEGVTGSSVICQITGRDEAIDKAAALAARRPKAGASVEQLRGCRDSAAAATREDMPPRRETAHGQNWAQMTDP